MIKSGAPQSTPHLIWVGAPMHRLINPWTIGALHSHPHHRPRLAGLPGKYNFTIILIIPGVFRGISRIFFYVTHFENFSQFGELYFID